MGTKRTVRPSRSRRPDAGGRRIVKGPDLEALSILSNDATPEADNDKVLVITLANSVHEEDGIGQRVANGLRRMKGLAHNLEILDEHTDLLGLGYRIRAARRVLIVDVFLGQNKNGRVHVISREDLAAFRGCALSARQLPAVESLELLLTVDPNLRRVEIYLILMEICTVKAAPELPVRFEASVQKVIRTMRNLMAAPFKELPPEEPTRRARHSASHGHAYRR